MSKTITDLRYLPNSNAADKPPNPPPIIPTSKISLAELLLLLFTELSMMLLSSGEDKSALFTFVLRYTLDYIYMRLGHNS